MNCVLKSPGPNRNGLIYTEEVLYKIAEQLKDKKIVGELNPNFKDASTEKMKSVNIFNASCSHENIRLEDGNLVSDVTLLSKEAEALVNSGMTYSFGLRGFGEVGLNEQGFKVVKPENYQVVTFDLITDPDVVWEPILSKDKI